MDFAARVCLCLAVSLLPAGAAMAEKVIVIDKGVQVFAGENPIQDVEPGTVLDVTKSDGEWRLVPRFKGWVRSSDVKTMDAALQHIDELNAKTPTAILAHYRGIVLVELQRYEEALQAFDAAEKAGLKEASLLTNRGNALQKSGQIEAAIAAYGQAIELDSSAARAFDNRSCALVEIGKLDEALADSNKAVELDAQSAEAWNNRGVVKRLQGKYLDAVRDYDEAIRISPWYAVAYANRAYAYKQLAQFEAARHSYELAIQAGPDFIGARNDLAWMLATSPHAAIRDGDRAVKLATEACERTGYEDPNYLDTLAAACAEQQDFENALKWQNALIEKLPEEQRREARERLKLYQQRQPFREELPPGAGADPS